MLFQERANKQKFKQNISINHWKNRLIIFTRLLFALSCWPVALEMSGVYLTNCAFATATRLGAMIY
jgi:hypothetical protein